MMVFHEARDLGPAGAQPGRREGAHPDRPEGAHSHRAEAAHPHPDRPEGAHPHRPEAAQPRRLADVHPLEPKDAHPNRLADAQPRRPAGVDFGEFDDFVRSRGNALLRFAYVLCGDAHLGEDLVQEVLARMHPRWGRVTVMENPEAYVRTAIVRQFLSWRRRRSAGEAVVAEVPEPAGLDEPQQRVLARDQMWQLLAGLPRSQRAVLVLRFYCDLADAEIATLLDCRETTVRSQAARALAKMRTMLGGQEVSGDG